MVQAARPSDEGGRPPMHGNPMRMEGNRRAQILSSKGQGGPAKRSGAENM